MDKLTLTFNAPLDGNDLLILFHLVEGTGLVTCVPDDRMSLTYIGPGESLTVLAQALADAVGMAEVKQ